MIKRPSFRTIYMQMAGLIAQRSTCKRLHVGCVIVSADWRRVLSVGYNGNASGLPNECDSDTPGACGDLHAEENACISCVESRATPKVVFCTHLPCKMCSKRLINLGGVVAVYYDVPYRLTESIDIFKHASIKVERLSVGIETTTYPEQLNLEYGAEK